MKGNADQRGESFMRERWKGLRPCAADLVKTGILSLYLFFIFYTQAFLQETDEGGSAFLLAFLWTALAAPAVYFLLRRLKSAELRPPEAGKGKASDLKTFLAGTLFILLVGILWYIGARPGYFSPDCVDQYKMAVSGEYNDWHPVWHTLLAFTLPLKLTGQTGALVLFQVISFALAAGYLGVVVRRHAGTLPAVLSLLYIGLNPYVFRVLMYPWKDVAFGTAGLLALTMAAEVYFSEDRRNRRWYLLLLGFAAANAALFRHNGILFAAPLVLVLLFHLPKKRMLYLLLSFVLTFLAVRVPLYRLLNVEQPDKRVVETTGLPMTVIANVAKEDPETLDFELKGFVYSMAPPSTWENGITGNFNETKWGAINTQPIEDAGAGKMLSWMFRCFENSPRAAYRALFALTDIVYGLETGTEGNVYGQRKTDDYGMAYAGNEPVENFLNGYQDFVDGSFLRYLRTYGVCLLAVLLLAVAKLKASSWKSWKKILLVLPLFAYDFGTMLLLTGPDSRFFWITFPVTPLLLALLLAKDEKEKITQS